MRRDRRQRCGHQHPHRCQDQRRSHCSPDLSRLCAQPAVEQDHGQREGADQVSQVRIVVADAARAIHAQQQAQYQEHQQQRRAEPPCQQRRGDAGEDQQRAGKQALVDGVQTIQDDARCRAGDRPIIGIARLRRCIRADRCAGDEGRCRPGETNPRGPDR